MSFSFLKETCWGCGNWITRNFEDRKNGSINVGTLVYIVTLGLKARTAEPDEKATVRQWLNNDVSMATNSRDRRNNRGTVGGGVFTSIRAEAISRQLAW
jgi:hypothetical protein